MLYLIITTSYLSRMQRPTQHIPSKEILEKIRKFLIKLEISPSITNTFVKILSYLPRSILLALMISGKNILDNTYLIKWYYLFPCGKKLNSQPNSSSPTNIIVSLTTIPSRVRYVPYVLGSLLRQTMRPQRIILYLDEKRFANQKLPFFLRLYQRHGVEIVYCEDLKPHTKYYHAMTAYPEAVIITVDDDLMYPKDLVESLYTSYRKYPHAVSCRRAHLMMFDENNKLKPYDKWDGEYSGLIDTPSMFLFATGVGGVLYPPHCLHKDTFQKNLIHDLSYKADDVWLKFMEILIGTPVVVAQEFKPYQNVNPGLLQKVALCKVNVSEGANDIQIQNCIKYYEKELGGNLYTTLTYLEQKITDASEKQTQP